MSLTTTDMATKYTIMLSQLCAECRKPLHERRNPFPQSLMLACAKLVSGQAYVDFKCSIVCNVCLLDKLTLANTIVEQALSEDPDVVQPKVDDVPTTAEVDDPWVKSSETCLSCHSPWDKHAKGCRYSGRD